MSISADHSPPRRVIGIDCATDPKNVGLALGTVGPTSIQIEDVAIEKTWDAVVLTVERWAAGSALIAIDAPLGWPANMGEALVQHRAGAEIELPANQIFRRRTDDEVYKTFGKRPLDVGSNLIARTAHSAVSLLGRLRRQMNHPIPLAWEPDIGNSIEAIEVYPAATLRSRGLSDKGYKGGKASAVSARESILQSLTPEIHIEKSIVDRARISDHVLDTVLCVMAGSDFLKGQAIAPEDPVLARCEGWIWVRDPNTDTK